MNNNTRKSLQQLLNELADDQNKNEIPLADFLRVLKPKMLQKIPAQKTNELINYYTKEEFPADDMVDDFNEDDIGNVQSLSEMNWALKEKRLVYQYLRKLFNLRKELAEYFVSVDSLNWSNYMKITSKEISTARQFINQECYNQFDTADDCVLRVVWVGLRSGVPNILGLIQDCYAKFNIDHLRSRISSKGTFHGGKVEMGQYVESSQYLIDRGRNILMDCSHSLFGYANRVTPRLSIQRAAFLIDDKIEPFLEYGTIVQQIIHELMCNNAEPEEDGNGNRNNSEYKENYGFDADQLDNSDDYYDQNLYPFQIDLVILPKASKEIHRTVGHLGGDDDETSSEEDDSDQERVPDLHDRYIPKYEYFMRGKYLANIFDEYNQKKIKKGLQWTFRVHPVFQIPDCRKSKPLIKRHLLQFVKTNFKRFKGRRTIIMIDRRMKAHSMNHTDQCMIYTAPDHLATITDGNEFQHYTVAASSYLVPEYRNLLDDRFCGAKFDANAKLFALSYQLKRKNLTRMHWFINGGGIRFKRHYMFDVWPQSFWQMEYDRGTYNKQWLERNWCLKLNHKMWDEWYKKISPPLNGLRSYDAKLHISKFSIVI